MAKVCSVSSKDRDWEFVLLAHPHWFKSVSPAKSPVKEAAGLLTLFSGWLMQPCLPSGDERKRKAENKGKES
jgi:hypothetical protein